LHAHARGDVVRDERRNADAEIDVEAVLELLRGAGRHLVAGPSHGRFRCPLGRVALAGRALLDALLGARDVDDALDVDSGGDDVVGIDLARLDQMLDLGDGEPGRGRHHRIEIARRLAVDEIAFRVARPSVDERDVGEEAGLHHVGLVVEVADFLALGDNGADARAGEEGGDAGAPGADAFGERALRIEFELELAREVETGENLVLANVARDHLLDLAGLEQDAEADPVDAGVVGNERQIPRARLAHRLDQRLGHPGEAEAARHQGHSILDLPGERLVGAGVDFSHDTSVSQDVAGS
jgi:hypothetical protein